MKIGCIPIKRISMDELIAYLGPLYYHDLRSQNKISTQILFGEKFMEPLPQ